jgi:hypothetical protein
VSVGHRQQLAAFHSLVLEGDGSGRWALHTAVDWQRRAVVQQGGAGAGRGASVPWQRRAGSAN